MDGLGPEGLWDRDEGPPGSLGPVGALGSANATAGKEAIAAPTPRATAKAPTRPMPPETLALVMLWIATTGFIELPIEAQ